MTKEKNYFIDNIRFISMLSIILYHVFCYAYQNDHTKHYYINSDLFPIFLYTQIGRFGNICFFLVSGFLFGLNIRKKSNNVESLLLDNYVQRRVNLLWRPILMLFFVVLINSLTIAILKYLLKGISFSLLDLLIGAISAQWFFFALISGLLIIKHFGEYKLLGVILSLFSLFYGINVYFQWIEIRSHFHLYSIPGFIFYLYIGFLFGKNEKLWSKILATIRKSLVLVIIVCIIVYTLSVMDSFSLYKIDGYLPFNNIKLTNQLFSILIFTLFASRFDKLPLYPQNYDPRMLSASHF